MPNVQGFAEFLRQQQRNEAVRISGQDVLMRNLRQLPISLQRKYNKQALRKAGWVIAKQARRNVKKPTKRQIKKQGLRDNQIRTGGLAKSLAVKIVGRYGAPSAGAIVGHRRDREYEGYSGKHVPANVAHLVELGHGGPKPAPPHPYLGPAYQQTKAEGKEVIATHLWASIRKERQTP